MCLVGSVGEVLGFEADGTPVGEGSAMCTLHTMIPVGSVELESRFGGVHFQRTSAFRFDAAGCKAEFAGLLFIQYVAMVVSACFSWMKSSLIRSPTV